MFQKLVIVAIALLGLASCSAPKKAAYIEPVISATDVKSDENKIDKKISSNIYTGYTISK